MKIQPTIDNMKITSFIHSFIHLFVYLFVYLFVMWKDDKIVSLQQRVSGYSLGNMANIHSFIHSFIRVTNHHILWLDLHIYKNVKWSRTLIKG